MAYDEMFKSRVVAREHYQALQRTLIGLASEELRKIQQAADLTLLQEGITFTVYGSKEGTERIFPNDLIPRIIPAGEWAQIEKGLTQRLTALNLFLRDIYHEGRILAEGIVPRELIYSCKHFRREMRGLNVPRDCGKHRGVWATAATTTVITGGQSDQKVPLKQPHAESHLAAL